MKWKFLALTALAAVLLAACGTSKVVSTVRVEGVVTNMVGVPSAGVRVLIPGKSVVTTDADGRFVFEDVTIPYTLIVEQETGKYVIYEGLTRTDPQPSAANDTGSFTVTIEGEVQGTTSGNRLGLQLVSRNALYTQSFGASDTATGYSFNTTLYKPTTTAELYALEWSRGADGNVQDYIAFGRYANTLDLVAGATLSNRNIALTTIAATHDLTVSTSGPSELNPKTYIAGVRFADEDVPAYPILGYVELSPPDAGYTARSPNLTDVQMLLGAAYMNGGDLFSIVWESVPATATSHVLSAPDLVALTAPEDGGTVSVGSSLGWEGPEGALYLTYLQGDLELTFITADTSVSLPDLSPFGADYGSNAYSWQIIAFRFGGVMEGEVDQAVAPGISSPYWMIFATIFNLPPSASGYMVSSPEYTFTVQ